MFPDSKAHGANMGPTWVLSAPDGLQVGPMNLAIRVVYTLMLDLMIVVELFVLYNVIN